MPSKFSPGVLPEEERRYFGREIADAIERFEAGQDRADLREQREKDQARTNIVGDLRVRDELRDRGFRRGEEPGPGGGPAGARAGPGSSPAARRPAGSMFDEPTPDIFEGRLPGGRGEGARTPGGGGPVDVEAEFDRFRSAGPDAMRKPVLLPGQFSPGAGFSPSAVFLPEVQQQPPHQSRETLEFGGEEFSLDPSQTPEALQERELQEAVDRLVAAGVDRPFAQVAARDQGLARELILREIRESDRPQDLEFTPEELISLGIPEDMAAAAAKDPALAQDLIMELQRRETRRTVPGGRGGGGSGGDVPGPVDQETALEWIDNWYGIWEGGELVGHHLDPADQYELARRWAAGEISREDFPSMPETEEPPPVDQAEEEGGGFMDAVSGAFRGGMNLLGQEGRDRMLSPPGGGNVERGIDLFRNRQRDVSPRDSGGPDQGALQEEVGAALRVVADFPNVDEATLRQILEEENYSDEAIREVLRRR